MDEKEGIILKGVRVHNLKNINTFIPHGKLVVITGLSGSGKSSLALDTLFAEGQRRYVESLSSYARQFLGRMHKPDVDFIDGIPPAVAIEQKVNTRNPRSTVGTSTEIYDFLKLLFARIGKTYSPISGTEVKRHNVSDVVEKIIQLPQESKVFICFKYKFNNIENKTSQLNLIIKQGYTRIFLDNEIIKIEDLIDSEKLEKQKEIKLILDRIVIKTDDKQYSRIADSVQTAFLEGDGECCIYSEINGEIKTFNFSNKFEADGIQFDIPSEALFSFNNPIGACPVCEGYGKILGIDEDLVIPDKSLSIYEDAVVCWKGEVMKEMKYEFIKKAAKYNFPIHKPYYELTPEQKDLLWNGNNEVIGINGFFEYLESKKQKIQYRVMISRYRGKTICPECKGKRLKKESFYVKIDGKSIGDLIDIPITELKDFFENIKLSNFDKKASERLINEIKLRLNALIDVGLGYLTLNRLSSTLSGGESQRINLATVFGAGLVGSLYVLDEPSIGLHPRDTKNLIKVLKQLRDKGNSVVVVEHDEEIIRFADYIIDIGPLAGIYGGEIIFEGTPEEMIKNSDTLTAKYLKGELSNPKNDTPDKSYNFIEIKGARHNNLKGIDVKFPLNVINVVTGVSGSGKSSLIKGVLYPAIKKRLSYTSEKTGEHKAIIGDFHLISDIVYIDQNPIGKSSRSNPATYIKAFDEIRKLFSEQKQSINNGYKPSHFSFNVPGGRCETCAGEGEIVVEMQFMADVHLVCEECNGKRFKDDILEIKFRGKNIYEVLEMSISEAVDFFGIDNDKTAQKISKLLNYYVETGLGYLKLGQSSSTLSGGESQRIKLASFLSQEKLQPTIFVFDEPTTGLHFHDISLLLKSFLRLKQAGHTLIIIEHNPEVIKFADWIIDLGPDGGENGGNLIFTGTFNDLINCKDSVTAQMLNKFKY